MNMARADACMATIVMRIHEAMSKGSRKAVGEMIPNRLATTIAMPDSCI